MILLIIVAAFFLFKIRTTKDITLNDKFKASIYLNSNNNPMPAKWGLYDLPGSTSEGRRIYWLSGILKKINKVKNAL